MPRNFRGKKPGFGSALAQTARGIARMGAVGRMARKAVPPTERRGKPGKLLQAKEIQRGKRALARARLIEELERNPEAKELFKKFDEEMRIVFGREYDRVIKSITQQTMKDIKVMLWNGFFVPAEINGLLLHIRESTPRKADPRDFRQRVREIVKQRQQEFQETGTLQTVFFRKAA